MNSNLPSYNPNPQLTRPTLSPTTASRMRAGGESEEGEAGEAGRGGEQQSSRRGAGTGGQKSTNRETGRVSGINWARQNVQGRGEHTGT